MKRICLVLLVVFVFGGVVVWYLLRSQGTVNEVTARNSYVGNGSTTAFTYGFRILTKNDIEVLIAGVAQIVDTDYTVRGLGDSGGGTVTFTTTPASGTAVTIIRLQKLEQQTDYLNNQTFASRAETLEKDLDKVIMGQQMQAEELDRGLKLAKQATLKYPELVAPIASEYVRWDNTGTKIEPGGSAAIATTNFLASGVGAVSRTISAKLGDFISVKDFGAAGDGVADDTTEIQAALTAATGTTLYFPAGTYVFNSQLIVPINTHILGAGHESTILDASGATNQAFGLIQAHGSISGSLGGGLTGSVTAGDLTLTLTSAPTLSPGDLIILHDPADGSWNPVNVSYRKGEFLIVKSLSGAVITLTGAVIDDYPASAEVYLVTPTSSSFRNFRIDGKPIDWTDPLQLDSLREQVRMPDGKGKGSHHGREKKVYSEFQAAGSGGTPQ